MVVDVDEVEEGADDDYYHSHQREERGDEIVNRPGVLRLSSQTVVDFFTLARSLRHLDDDDDGEGDEDGGPSAPSYDCLSLYRLRLDYNEAHEVIAQMHRFRAIELHDCHGTSVPLIIEHLLSGVSGGEIGNNQSARAMERLHYACHDDEMDANVLSSLCRGLQGNSHRLKDLSLRISMTELTTQRLFADGINQSLSAASCTDTSWGNITFLKNLDLSQCDLDGETAISALCKGLSDKVGLVSLKLENCQLHDDEVADIVRAVGDHPTLAELSVALNYAGTETVVEVARLLRKQSNSVGDSNNGTDSVMGGRLERLDLGQQNPGHLRNLNVVCEALEHNAYLRELVLRENYLSRAHIPALVNALMVNTRLEELNLEDCDLRSDGVELLVRNLGRFPKLRKLYLRQNTAVRDLDLSALLSTVMVQNHVLHVLDLEDEWISDKKQMQDVELYLHLNRSGRQFLTRGGLPLSVWPFLLERVESRLFRSSDGGQWHRSEVGNATLEETVTVPLQATMCARSTIFFLLHGPALCERQHGLETF